MKSYAIIFAAFAALAASDVHAQSRSRRPEPADTSGISRVDVPPTTEMWFYEQAMRQYENPQFSVRQKAEFRAAQRRNRIAAMKWFGLSNSRPVANPTPLFGTYSPAWQGSHGNPYRWTGAGLPAIVVRPNESSPGNSFGLW